MNSIFNHHNAKVPFSEVGVLDDDGVAGLRAELGREQVVGVDNQLCRLKRSRLKNIRKNNK
jgi:hypothetical protein